MSALRILVILNEEKLEKMVKLKLKYFDGNEEIEIVNPLVFPDQTSQVFRVKAITKNYRNVVSSEIIWQFENEAEFMHVAQLSDLLDSYTGDPRPLKILNIPFLPYGRQDKAISNNSTFAQRTFTKMIDSLNFDRVITFDCHGVCTIKNLIKLSANETIKKVFEDNKYDVYCYGDGSACKRYLHEPSINGVKVRNQQTGNIEEYYLVTEYENKLGNNVGVDPKDKRILIVDDILDGGATFIQLMSLLKEHNVGEVGLYTSHAIASKGYDHLKEAGISQFFTTNSLTKNEESGIKIV